MPNELVIAELQRYKDIVGRIKVLETYSWSGGILLKTISEDDRLQELHKKLRGMKSYMYLSKHEQEIETTAHAYLTRYPAGTKAQLNLVRSCNGVDPEDENLLRELERKIRKVIDARGNSSEDNMEELIERISELQDLQAEKARIDNVLNIMELHHDHLSKLLRLRYTDGFKVDEVAAELSIVPRTYRRWHSRAIEQYAKLSGF
jgi:type I site-specific restriction-modification system R (restriction) subunit